MKHRELFIKRVLTGFAVGLGLLAGALLVSGIALRGPAGLNLFAWGLALAPLAVGVIILRACLLFLVNKVKTSNKLISLVIKAKDHKMPFRQTTENRVRRHMAMSSVFAVMPGVEEQQETESEVTNFLYPPRDSLAAHFNWDSGEYEERGMGGDFDPPYDLTKG